MFFAREAPSFGQPHLIDFAHAKALFHAWDTWIVWVRGQQASKTTLSCFGLA